MEKVEFLQFEIFESGKRVAQFGGSVVDRQKLTRKARTMAKKLVAKWQELNNDPLVWPCHRVSVRRWRGGAMIDTINGQLTLCGSYDPKNPSWTDTICTYELDSLEEFFKAYTNECIRIDDGYKREYRF